MQTLLASRPRLLLIESDPMVRDIIALMLQEHYEIAAAMPGFPAANTPAIDVVLLDCLPPLSRITELLTEADRRGVPAVLIGGDPEHARRVDASRPFVAKPFTQLALLSALDSARG